MYLQNQMTVSVRQAAKKVRFPGGEKKFMAWLRNKKFLFASNEPYQRYVDAGWFILSTKTIHKANPPFTVTVTRVTNKGIAKLEQLVYQEFYKCNCP